MSSNFDIDASLNFFTTQPNDLSFNNAGTVSGGERFFLSAMDFSLNATQLTIPGGEDTEPFDSDCWAHLKIPVSYARNLFQYQADGVDVDDINTDDVKYRVFHRDLDPSGNYFAENQLSENVTFYNSKNVLPAQAITYFKSIPYYGSVNATIDGSKVDPDFVRYVSQQTFGVSSTDMYDNELDVRRSILNNSCIVYMNKIKELAAMADVYWNDVSGSSADANYPPKAIHRQMLNNVRTRFENLNTAPGGQPNDLVYLYDESGNEFVLPELDDSFNDITYNYGDLWRKLPLMIGDYLYFNMTITPDPLQKTLDGQTTIGPRTYRIRLDIVDDFDEDIASGSLSPSYFRAWDTVGYDPTSTTEPPYLQDQGEAETNANY
jgi:hypothetical protein